MKETMVETEVTYTLEHGGRFYIIEHVPARVCRETEEFRGQSFGVRSEFRGQVFTLAIF